MRTALSLAVVALCASPLAEATVTTEVMPGAGVFTEGSFIRRQPVQNLTEDMRKLKRGPSLNDMEEENKARKERIRERNERARQKLETYHPDPAQMTRMSKEEVDKMAEEDHPWMRGLGWGSTSSAAYADFLADPTQEYDKWAQAYRMLGGYIDCDHQKDGDDHHSGDDNNAEDNSNACSRWMIWAAVRIINMPADCAHPYSLLTKHHCLLPLFSMSMRITRVMDTASTMATTLLVSWTVTTLTPAGYS